MNSSHISVGSIYMVPSGQAPSAAPLCLSPLLHLSTISRKQSLLPPLSPRRALEPICCGLFHANQQTLSSCTLLEKGRLCRLVQQRSSSEKDKVAIYHLELRPMGREILAPRAAQRLPQQSPVPSGSHPEPRKKSPLLLPWQQMDFPKEAVRNA